MADNSFEVKVDVPDGIEHGAVLLSEEVGTELRNSGLSVESAAKKLAPKMTGNLKRSIVSSVAPIGGNPTALIVAQAKYAASVEFGSKPHTPPFGPIRRYAERKGIPEAAGGIWMTIRRQGTKEHPFMRPAFAAKKASVEDRMKKAIAKAVERMRG